MTVENDTNTERVSATVSIWLDGVQERDLGELRRALRELAGQFGTATVEVSVGALNTSPTPGVRMRIPRRG